MLLGAYNFEQNKPLSFLNYAAWVFCYSNNKKTTTLSKASKPHSQNHSSKIARYYSVNIVRSLAIPRLDCSVKAAILNV